MQILGNFLQINDTTSNANFNTGVKSTGTAARESGMERHTTANTAGNDLTNVAGGATSGATNKKGGTYIISGGTSTGTGTSQVAIYTASAGSTGTADNAPTEKVTTLGNGNTGFGTTSPTAVVHVRAGTTAAGTAPLKLTTGTSMTAAEAGAVEFTTDDLFFTITTGTARKAVILDDGTRLTSGKIPVASTNGRLIDGQTPLAGTKVYYVSDTSGGAVTRKLTFTNGILTSET